MVASKNEQNPQRDSFKPGTQPHTDLVRETPNRILCEASISERAIEVKT